MTQLRQAVRRLIREHLLLKTGESVAIVSVGDVGDLADLAWRQALRLRSRPLAVRLPALRAPANGLPAPVLALLKAVDAFLLFTPVALHQEQLRSMSAGPARGLQVAAINKHTLFRVLSADPREVADRSRRLADIFSIGKNLEVETPMGTQVTLSVVRAKGVAETGLAHESSQMAQVPAGKATVVPVHRSVEGVIVAERILGHPEPFSQPVRVYLRQGVVTQVKGGAAARPIRNLLARVRKEKRGVLRLSFGTNHGAQLGHSALEDDVVMGTLHVCLGGAEARAGGAISEVQIVLTRATMIIDKHTIVEKGRIVV